MPIDLFEEFNVSLEAEEGQWFDMGQGARIKIRSTDSARYEKTLAKTRKRLKPNGPDSLLKSSMIEAMAEALIVDWKGVQKEGKHLECNLQHKREALEMKPFRDFVMNLATDLELFRKKAELD